MPRGARMIGMEGMGVAMAYLVGSPSSPSSEVAGSSSGLACPGAFSISMKLWMKPQLEQAMECTGALCVKPPPG